MQPTIAAQQKIIAAGPCSAESREQVMETARQLAGEGIRIFRAGLWKPRTRPGHFEGVGAEGIEWLTEARTAYGLRIATELNNARNADLLLKAGIDIAWIGARTSANPFDVQEMAAALRGCAIDVYIKNPVAPDPELWLGAVERLERANIKGRIVAIHRGFSVWGKDIFRNAPIWEIPLWLKEQRPDLPVICDPSHIAGQARLVPHVARLGMTLGLDGLFVESHCNPTAALSDAAQQLTPTQLGDLIRELQLTD